MDGNRLVALKMGSEKKISRWRTIGWLWVFAVVSCGHPDGAPPQAPSPGPWAGDPCFRPSEHGPWNIFVEKFPLQKRSDTLPTTLSGLLRIPPNEEETYFFPRWKYPLDTNRTLYLLETEDEGHRNAWLYVYDRTTGTFWSDPALVAYFYREDEQCGALESWATWGPTGELTVWQREKTEYLAVDSLPDEPGSELFMGLRLGEKNWEKLWDEAPSDTVPWHYRE
jgi:hypothetical protein